MEGLPVFRSLCPEKVRYTHPVRRAPPTRPAGWSVTALLFGVPALAFAFLFHWLGPNLRRGGASWWRIFHLLLILPLTCMFVAAIIGAAVDQRSTSWKDIKQRLRLSAPSATAWLWAAALSGFMYGANWADFLAVAASWLALWKEKTGQKWMFGAILIAMLVKRYTPASFKLLWSPSDSSTLPRSTASSSATSVPRISWACLCTEPGRFSSTTQS